MTRTIQREIQIPQPREQVWRAITESAILAKWMFPNDFEPRVGHHFTFQVPPNPKTNFDSISVHFPRTCAGAIPPWCTHMQSMLTQT